MSIRDDHAPIEYICEDCGEVFTVDDENLECPKCGSENVKPNGDITYLFGG